MVSAIWKSFYFRGQNLRTRSMNGYGGIELSLQKLKKKFNRIKNMAKVN